MSQRQSELLRLRDLLEHLQAFQDQLEWCEDPATIHYLSETMLRDLDASRRICAMLHRSAAMQVVN
jgi:hypothetical protein